MLKGMDKFLSKVPALKGKRVGLVPAYGFSVLTLAFCLMLGFDLLPGTLPPPAARSAPAAFLPLAGVCLVGLTGLILVWQMWFRRDRLRRKYGARAYGRIFFVGFAGVGMLFAVALHQFVPARLLAEGFWAGQPLAWLAAPLQPLTTPDGAGVVAAARIVLAAFMSATGLLLFVRALAAFGVDYMTVVYLYFPKESRVQRHEIYSALRHPAYAAALYLALAGTVLTATLLSLIAFALYALAFLIHVRFVEERELVERFGESYRAYRASVPAFFTLRLGVLFRFLLGIGRRRSRKKRSERSPRPVAPAGT